MKDITMSFAVPDRATGVITAELPCRHVRINIMPERWQNAEPAEKRLCPVCHARYDVICVRTEIPEFPGAENWKLEVVVFMASDGFLVELWRQ